MDSEFQKKDVSPEISQLIRTFLHDFHVIHPINEEMFLVPSAMRPQPLLDLDFETGNFPRRPAPPLGGGAIANGGTLSLMNASVGGGGGGGGHVLLKSAAAVVDRPVHRGLHLEETGLIFRRLFLLPPIASGFWSKLISLCLQKNDFQLLVHREAPGLMFQGEAAYRLRSMIGSMELSWQYWKTGIILMLDDKMLLRVNSLHADEFEDPSKQLPVSRTREMVNNLVYESEEQIQTPPKHFTEVIEVIVPEINILTPDVDSDPLTASSPLSSSLTSLSSSCSSSSSSCSCPKCVHCMSAKILTKILEIVDEVLKQPLQQPGIFRHLQRQ